MLDTTIWVRVCVPSVNNTYPMKTHTVSYKSIALLCITTLLVPILAYILTPSAYGVADIEWNDASTFGAGVFENATTTEDTVTLAHDMTGARTDTTYEDFSAGNTLYSDFNRIAVIEDGGLEMNRGWVYTNVTDPVLVGNADHIFRNNNLLYVSTNGGLSVINTQGTVDPGDDTLVTRYHTGSTPALVSNSVWDAILDNNLLYVSTRYGGLSVINLNNEYNEEGIYIGEAQRIADTPTTTLTWSGDIPEDTAVSLQYRTGSSDAAYFNDFDDNLTTEYAGDWGGWGDAFQDAEESNGTMKLSNPDTYVSGDNSDSYAWIDTGKPDDYFALGTKVTARVRINSDTRVISDWWEYMFTDDWWDDDAFQLPNNEWHISSFIAGLKTFSKIGFDITWQTGTWAPTDTIEIDWIRIETPDSMGEWSTWSDPCTSTTCAIDPATLTGNEWIQYKLNLTTDNPLTTPLVHSVSYTKGYHATGTYTSEDITFDGTQPLSFTTTQSTPASTTLTYAYSTDHGSTWTDIASTHTFPSSFTPSSFMWRATLTTTDVTKTPVLESATLTTGPIHHTQTGSISVQAKLKELEAEGKNIEAELLKRKYPDLFTEPKNPAHRMEMTLSLMREVIIRMEMLVEIRAAKRTGE